LALPLETNPAWTTHRIIYRGKVIGRQLSVPSLSDCDWYRSNNGIYADRSHTWAAPQHRKVGLGNLKRGRPTREESERRERMLLAEVGA